METLEDEWYIVIKAYKSTIFEISRGILYYHILCICQIYTSGNVKYAWGQCGPVGKASSLLAAQSLLRNSELVKYPTVPDLPKVRYSK